MWFSNAHILCFFPRNLEKRSCALKGQTGVSCVKNYVSKRKKRGYKFWGLVRFGGKLHHEKSCKLTNPPKRTQVSYVSKRSFLHNRPLSILWQHTHLWRIFQWWAFQKTWNWPPIRWSFLHFLLCMWSFERPFLGFFQTLTTEKSATGQS